MDSEKTPVIFPWDDNSSQDNPGKQNTQTLDTEDSSIDKVLDSACDGLKNIHIQHSIKRIHEMEEELDKLEKELNQFLNSSANLDIPQKK